MCLEKSFRKHVDKYLSKVCQKVCIKNVCTTEQKKVVHKNMYEKVCMEKCEEKVCMKNDHETRVWLCDEII